MRVKPTQVDARNEPARSLGRGLVLRLAGCFLSLLLATGVVPYVEHWWPENNFLWIANGLFLAFSVACPAMALESTTSL